MAVNRNGGINKSIIMLTMLFFPLFAMGQESSKLREQIQGLPHLPDGHVLVAFVDCGGTENFGADKGEKFRLITGTPTSIPQGKGSLSSAVQHEDRITYALLGLEPDNDYVLGVTWWDFDDQGRQQDLQIATEETSEWKTLLPPGRPLAFHKGQATWARVHVPLERSVTSNGQAIVAITNTTGPNAVVNTLWLLKKISKEDRKRVLIVTGDEYEGHAWRETSAEFAAILRDDPRLEVTITETPRVFASPIINHYDAVFLNFKDYPDQLTCSQAEWTGIRRYIDSGKGFVMAHFAIGAFEEWEGFVDVVGRVWNPKKRGHDPYGNFEVLVNNEKHPVTDGLKDFQTIGELYTCLDGSGEIDILCQARSIKDDKLYPMAFVYPTSRGRIFQCTLGHDLNALRSEGTRKLYRRATAWATGLDQLPSKDN